jgi:tetratricopeptide (TPR) repeat protein
MVAAAYVQARCWVARAAQGTGDHDRADSIFSQSGSYADCDRFCGDILDGRADWPGAQKAYAEAVARAPDLPAAYYSWRAALARHRDLAGAEGKLKDANRRGPNWANPLKALGDVLAKRSRAKEALVKYDEALKYAPNWQ